MLAATGVRIGFVTATSYAQALGAALREHPVIEPGKLDVLSVDAVLAVAVAAAKLSTAPGRPMRDFCREYRELVDATESMKAGRAP